jgi:hypothetical protein
MIFGRQWTVLCITVQPNRLGQPSKNISVLTDFLCESFGAKVSETLSIQKAWQCPSLAEVTLSMDEAIWPPVQRDILSRSDRLTFSTKEMSFARSS